jgi:rhodanese-related sulfurtransferase
MTAASISPAEAWQRSQATGHPILDLRSRAERARFGWPPGSVRVSLARHWLRPEPGGIYLCQHAVRSKLPAARGGLEVAGGFVAWQAAGLPVERGRPPR